MPKVSLESVQKECVAARTGAWVLQRSVKDFWRHCGAFEAFEGAKSQSRKRTARLSGCHHGGLGAVQKKFCSCQHRGLGAAKVGKGSLEALRSVLTKSLEKKQLQKESICPWKVRVPKVSLEACRKTVRLLRRGLGCLLELQEWV